MDKTRTLLQPGPRNLITDVSGLMVGNADDAGVKSGVTVVTANKPFVASVEVMGGAPGTRETDCLSPHNLVDKVDALVLSGGSAFGLDAASGVADLLRERGRGYPVGPVSVPIVPAAILFDLLNGGDKNWQCNPYNALGRKALEAASDVFQLGTTGAGYGATSENLKGGLGSASIVLENGVTVAALVAANPRGSAVVPGTGVFWAGAFELNNEYGGKGIASPDNSAEGYQHQNESGFNPRANTTIAIVATDAKLNKSENKRVAVAAHDGMARAIVPSHTLFDGDLVFAVSTGEKTLADQPADQMAIGHAAAVCLTRAIARGIFTASPMPGDTLPCWKTAFGNAT